MTISIVIGLVVSSIMFTTGRTAATEESVLSTIDSIGTRLIVITDQGSAEISASSVTAINNLSGVEWALGLGPAFELENASLTSGHRAVFRNYFGDLTSTVDLTSGRMPANSGEAVVGTIAQSDLSLMQPVGGAHGSDGTATIVGGITAHPSLNFVANLGLIHQQNPAGHTTRFIYVLVKDVSLVTGLKEDIRSVLHYQYSDHVDISDPSGVIALRETIQSTLASNSRQLMLGILGIGLVISCVVSFSLVNRTRRDIGRRRALGASRSAIVLLVLTQTGASALLGAVLATGTSYLIGARISVAPPVSFGISVALLTTLVAALGAIPPALSAAFRDPVRILRVP